mmetsp:Transcript_31164/g.50410  ORF Transcript_31164/g.50410 Transcript_31164/m.50410 type:complete len:549 (+) Transcript_31164:2269-3915(+)
MRPCRTPQHSPWHAVPSEMRTPASSIIGMSGLMMETALSEQQREMCMVINSSAEHLLSVINDFLDLAAFESGRVRLSSAPFDIHTVVEDTLGAVTNQSFKKGVLLGSYIDPRVPDVMLGDASRIKQVITNLLSNAVKFLEPTKAIKEVQVTVDLLATTNTEYVIQCSVSDTGPGIKSADFSLLFNRFSQIDPSSSRSHEGSGLGLAICRSIISYMKGSSSSVECFGAGTINVRSQWGKGSEFYFVISLGRPPTPKPTFSPVPSPLHILQHATPFTAKLLERQLTAYGHTVSNAASLEEACQVLRREIDHIADIVILDAEGVDEEGMEDLHRRLGEGGGGGGGGPGSSAPLSKACVLLLNKNRTYPRSEWFLTTFSAVLFKPCGQRKVIATIAAAMSHQAGQPLERMNTPIQKVSPTAPDPAKRQRARSILVVEDNTVNQLVARRLLEQLGHSVEVAGDGLQAAELLTKPHTFDLCFMDCQMPRADGYQSTGLVRKYEQESKARNLPIVGLTAHALPGDRQKCLDAGMSDYLSKPMKKQQLADMIEKWT